MIIDISKLLLNQVEELEIQDKVLIPYENISKSNIRKLDNLYFNGNITKLVDDTLELNGILTGIMILPDDISLEDVNYPFNIKIEEKIEKFKNLLDISSILWQNILVEIPAKVHSNNKSNVSLKGDGWRVITEEEFMKERNSNNYSND